MNPPLLASDNDCMGCSACANICPHDAISMPWNIEGFHTPVVDLDICTHCNACTKVCPPLNETQPVNNQQLKTPDVYGGWHLNHKIREASSSGGIFTALAEQILDEGGCVFGAAQNADLTLSHRCIENKDDLSCLRGSKYFQSDIGATFRQVRLMLKNKRPVLFSGTPCQISGLLSYMRKPHPLLLTCDLACHGTPSYRLFQSYADYYTQKAASRLTGTDFRNKDSGWLHFSMKRYFQSGEISSTWYGEDLFMRGFLSDICLGKACYGCPWNAFPRQADITLADYWGVQEKHPEWQTEQGVSIVFANTETGRIWLDKVRNRLYLHRETMENLPDGSRWNQGLSSIPVSMPNRRERFLKDLAHMDVATAIDKHTVERRAKFDVGIVGMWMTCNYGALLTTFALYRLLESMNQDPILIDHSPMMQVARFAEQDNRFRRFVRACGMKTTPPLGHAQALNRLNNEIDTFLVASDQVWRHEYTASCGYYYFLDFARGDKRKIAFGSSFGSEQDTSPEEFRSMAACCLQRFDAVAVREANAVDILQERYGINAQTVLDPVFLCDKNLYDQLIARSKQQEDEEFILSYMLDPTDFKRQILLRTAQREQAKLVNMVDAQLDFKANKTKLDLENTIDDLSLEDWLYYVSRCRLLITDSFHGACFAIIFNKPFICIANRERGLPRFTSLLEQTGLMSQLIFPSDRVDMVDTIPRDIDYAKVNLLLEQARRHSCDWLRHALNQKRDPSRIVSGSLFDQIVKSHTELASLKEEEQRHLHDFNTRMESVTGQIAQINAAEQEHFHLTQTQHQDLSSQQHHLTRQLQEESRRREIMLVQLYRLPYYQRKYRYYSILSKITWGKKRKHYQRKKWQYKAKIKELRSHVNSIALF